MYMYQFVLPSGRTSVYVGYVDDTSYNVWWPQTVENIEAFLKGEPLRLMK